MTEQRNRLEELTAELRDVNEALARTSRPLERVSEMTLAERNVLSAQIRAGLARWEAVSREISRVMNSAEGAADATPAGAAPDASSPSPRSDRE